MKENWNTALNKELVKRVGEKTKLACPECGAVMAIRQNRRDNTFFLGCHRYPNCTHTMEIPETLRLELLGFKQLPGFAP